MIGVNDIFLLVLVITALDFCSTRPQNYGKSSTSCLKKTGSIVPKFKRVGKYANVTLTCPFNAIKYEFFKSCLPIKQSLIKRNKLKISGKTLTLKRFITMDSGMYTCQGTDANGHIKEFTWVLHIPHRPNPASNPTSEERPENEAIMMDCRAFHGKRLFYSHNKRNPILLKSSRLVGNTNSGIYELLDLTIDDSGYYYCGDTQQSGKRDLPRLLLKLTVRELPKVKGKQVAKAGDSVKFECEYRGPQTIAWYKDKKPVPVQNKNRNKAQVKQANKSNYKSVLKLDLVNVQPSSAGNYACRVEFDNNITVSQTIQLKIFDFLENPIRFRGDSSTMNSTVIIACTTNMDNTKYSLLKRPLFSLNPKPRYKKIAMGPRISDFGYGIFLISPLSAADEGYYKCGASWGGLTIERELPNPIWLATS